MTGERVALIDGDIVRGHAVEIIVRCVVLAHVIEAEAEELALAVAALRSPKLTDRAATGKVATHVVRLGRRLGVGLDADAVEEARVEVHVWVIMGVFRIASSIEDVHSARASPQPATQIPKGPSPIRYKEMEMNEQGHPVADRIRETLTDALAPETLHVIDDSHKHAGHAHRLSRPGGAKGTSETHFNIKVVSRKRFEGKTRLERHRIINALLAGEMGAEKVHALAIDARAPGE